MSESEHIDEQEWDDISDKLSDYHSIFSKFWGMGRPRLTESIDTAKVSFDISGQAVSWELNPKFWSSLSDEGKIFAIAHESMHVIFSHGVRYQEQIKKYDPEHVNAAMDITVNDYLERNYGFIRNEVEPRGVRYCWLDELLPGEPAGKNFEYYLAKLAKQNPAVEAKQESKKREESKDSKPSESDDKDSEKSEDEKSQNGDESDETNGDQDQESSGEGQADGDEAQGNSAEGNGESKSQQGKPGQSSQGWTPKQDNANMGNTKASGQGSQDAKSQKSTEPKPMQASTVDDHSELDSFKDSGVSEMLDRTTDAGTKKDLIKIAESDVTDQMKAAATAKQAGVLPGNSPGNTFIEFASLRRLKPKPRWETIIKRWTRKALSDDATEISWVNESRRIDPRMLGDLTLPAEGEGENFEKKRIRVAFFLDTSGSCIHLAERFFRAAKTLDPRRFDVRLYCFDTRVYKTSLKDAKVYGGGGTSFSIIENALQQEMTERQESYPEAVFMITDCYGDFVQPEKPNRWHIFVTEHGDPSGAGCFPVGVNYYHLKHFE